MLHVSVGSSVPVDHYCSDTKWYCTPMCFACLWIVIGTGNSGVEKGYPYPNPKIPLPLMTGIGIEGLGWQVARVPDVMCWVVRKPITLSWVHVGFWIFMKTCYLSKGKGLEN